MADDLRTLALDLHNFMVKTHRITDIEGPDALSDDWRSWEISFTYRGLRRHYIYRVQRQDPKGTMLQALRAESTGELMVRIPKVETSGVQSNEIYYPPHG